MRLLVGFDGSPPSRLALGHAMRRAAEAKDELHVVTVIPAAVRDSSLARMMPAGLELPPQMNGTFEDTARRRLDEVLEQARKHGARATGEVRAGEACHEILRAAEEFKADEIVIGHKSFEGPEFSFGKNAREIVRQSKVPVTVVRS